ncbi:MAG: glycosyltransferase involved in cell wall biosynthesis [Halieaceae bacterium]
MKPLLSIVLIVYKMPAQALRTLESLSVKYQQGVSQQDYEVIVMENASSDLLGEEQALQYPGNFRYFLREESLPTPVPAVLFGVEQAKSDLLGIMVDGARMASPGLVAQIIAASRSNPEAVISVPGYHLGSMLQQEAVSQGYDETVENQLLAGISWPEDGYRLFDISVLSGSCRAGVFRPNAESNCLCIPRQLWNAVGGMDPRFTETGGGQANPDLYKRVCEHGDTTLLVIPGEGTFHQFHGGVTTGTAPVEREQHMQNHFEQYKSIRGEYFQSPKKEALLFGSVPRPAMRFLYSSMLSAGFKPTAAAKSGPPSSRVRPKISVIVIGYRMAIQLRNTLETLTPGYQRDIEASDYEVVIVENSSADNLDQNTISRLPDNFSYYLREEEGQSPVPAINYAFDRCRGEYVGLIIDGARMLSPGILSAALKAWSLDTNALAVIPGYHLGEQEQHQHTDAEQALREEQALLNSIAWRQRGYDLFTISTFSGANRNGYLHPIMECNCVFASMRNFKRIGYANPDFTLRGGGSINLHIYRSLGMLGDTAVYLFPGEGSFHQYHDGVTTSSYEDRQAEIGRHKVQLHSYWPGGFHSLRREPSLLGKVPPQAQRFLQSSLARAEQRTKKLANLKLPLWPDDPQQVDEEQGVPI